MIKIALFGLTVLLLGLAGCGIKGDPMPPAEQQTIQATQEMVPAQPAPAKPNETKKTKKKNEN